MGHGRQAELARAGEDPGELRRRMSLLAGIQPHRGDAVEVGHGLVEGSEGVVLVKMAQEAQDQARTYAMTALALGQRVAKTVDDRGEGHAAAGVSLRIEEDFHVAHPLGRHPVEVGQGEIAEILALHQHLHALVVDVEEILQAGEVVGRAQRLHRGMGELDAVARGDGKHQLRLEGALDVQVQLGLWQVLDERGYVHGDGFWLAGPGRPGMGNGSLGRA